MSTSSATPWIVTYQDPLSLDFPRRKFQSELTFPSPRDLPDPGMEPLSPALEGRFLNTEPSRKPVNQPQVYILNVSPTLSPSFSSRLLQSTRLSFLCYIATSYQLSILHTVVYIFQCYSLNSSHPLLPPLCPQVCSIPFKNECHSFQCTSPSFLLNLLLFIFVIFVVIVNGIVFLISLSTSSLLACRNTTCYRFSCDDFVPCHFTVFIFNSIFGEVQDFLYVKSGHVQQSQLYFFLSNLDAFFLT